MLADEEETFWTAVTARNSGADGTFVFAVKTTGIFCRPSCPSRRANRSNVTFFKSAADARKAGYRDCKRCNPGLAPSRRPHAASIEQACRTIATAEREPALPELANSAGLSPFHFQRLFKEFVGVTPKAYAHAHRRLRVPAHLREAATVTDAIYDSGFQSVARFYASAADTLGMAPRKFRQGAGGMQLTYIIGASEFGRVLAALSTQGIAAILLGDSDAAVTKELSARFPNAEFIPGDKAAAKTLAGIIACIEKPERTLDLPLDIRGTSFQQQVWAALRKLKPGTTASYTQIAETIGRPKASRAVAAACAANSHAVAIPCHRVVRANGDLSGYRWGIERKRALLAHEAACGKQKSINRK